MLGGAFINSSTLRPAASGFLLRPAFRPVKLCRRDLFLWAFRRRFFKLFTILVVAAWLVVLRFLVVRLKPFSPSKGLPTTEDVSVDEDTKLVDEDILETVFLDGALNRARVMKSVDA